MKKKNTILALLIMAPSVAFPNSGEIQALDLDSLMDSDIQLSTVTRRLQLARESAASIYVLSGEEINQSGVTSIPQALSLVPGMQVRRIDNNNWAITLRGIAGRYSSKMLVLINGQSIYDAVDGGVNWEALNLPLYDLERIEVVRSQGGLSWGSNATNGVVNIITKHSEDTRGITVQLEAGNQLNHNASMSYGRDLQELGSFRIHAFNKKLNQSDQAYYSVEPNDDSKTQGFGTRFDINLSEQLFMLLQSDYQHIHANSTVLAPDLTDNSTVYTQVNDKRELYNMMARLDHIISPNASQMYQLTFSSEEYDSFYFQDKQREFDADYLISAEVDAFQFDFGLNYRYIELSLDDNDYLSSINDLDKVQYYSVFTQVQYEMVPDELRFIVGNKSERNDKIDWQHQPSAKVIWTPDDKNTLWGSVSQGARFPSFTEMDLQIRIPSSPFFAQYIQGNEDIEAELSVSQELGYRYVENTWDVDLSLFNTRSRNVLTTEFSVTPSAYIQSFVSEGELDTYGGELIIGWQIMPELRSELGYSYAHLEYDLPSTVSSPTGDDESDLKQWLFKLSASLTESHSLYTAARREQGEAYSCDDYYALDVSWQWQITPDIQFGLTGNNLFISDRIEYANVRQLFVVPSYVEPAVTAKLKIEF